MEQKTDYKKPEVLKRILYKAPGHAAKVMHVDAKYLCNLKHLVANADIVEHVPMIPAIVEGSPIQICVDEDGHPKRLPFNFPQFVFAVEAFAHHSGLRRLGVSS